MCRCRVRFAQASKQASKSLLACLVRACVLSVVEIGHMVKTKVPGTCNPQLMGISAKFTFF